MSAPAASDPYGLVFQRDFVRDKITSWLSRQD
jgi:hypothetical protein